jgi:hypothetical protein
MDRGDIGTQETRPSFGRHRSAIFNIINVHISFGHELGRTRIPWADFYWPASILEGWGSTIELHPQGANLYRLRAEA